MNEIDFIITTFERYDLLYKLLKSIKLYYPNKDVSIADDSDKEGIKWNSFGDNYNIYDDMYDIPNLKISGLDFDSGLSAKRNALIKNTYNPYILLLEDDFEFTDNTKIEKMLEIMKEQDADIVGGKVINWDGQEIHFEHRLSEDLAYDLNKRFIGNVLTEIEDRENPDVVLNFALFNRRVFDKCLWDENLKLAEHNDFYLRLKQFNPKIVYTQEVSIKHNKGLNESIDYKNYRQRQNEFLKIMMKKNNLKFIYKSNGKVIELTDEGNLKISRRKV